MDGYLLDNIKLSTSASLLSNINISTRIISLSEPKSILLNPRLIRGSDSSSTFPGDLGGVGKGAPLALNRDRSSV